MATIRLQVGELRSKLLEKLEQFLVNLQVNYGKAQKGLAESDEHFIPESMSSPTSHEVCR